MLRCERLEEAGYAGEIIEIKEREKEARDESD